MIGNEQVCQLMAPAEEGGNGQVIFMCDSSRAAQVAFCVREDKKKNCMKEKEESRDE